MAKAYDQASRMLDKMIEGKAGIKSLTYNDPALKNRRQAYALVCETLKYKQVLEHILQSTGLHKAKVRPTLLLVLTYELLFGRGKIQGGGKVKRIIMAKASKLREALTRLKIRLGAQSSQDLLPESVRAVDRMPRYCRVNLIITTVEAVVKKLEDSGFEEVEASESAPEGKSFFRDRQVPGVLVFAPRTDLHDHLLVVSGALVLQDKSSCFPAHALSPSPTWDCIDACAAPGNKTSHLIAIIHSRLANNELAQDCSSIPAPTVTAFERDAGRAKLLGRRLEKMGVCPNVKGAGGWKGKEWRGATDGGRVLVCVRKGSFLDAKPQDYPNVRAIVVDPTCSGSGMVGRVDHLLRETEPLFPASSTSSTTYNGKNMGGKKRKRGVNPTSESSKEVVSKVESIAAFQKKIVSHALSFPSVQIVAYSTCSIHNEENEEVVRFALKDNPDFRLKRALPAWKRRGAEGMESCVRVDPIQDLTTGFFVALFERHRTSRTAVNKTSVTKTSVTKTSVTKTSQPLNHVVSRRNQISSSMSAKREVGDAKKLGAGGGTVCAPSGGRGRKRRKKRPVRVKLMKF